MALAACTELAHVELSGLEQGTLDYAIASLTCEAFPQGLHHDERLPLAGFLLKRSFAEPRVQRLLQTVCAYQAASGIPEMGTYDVEDAAAIVESTAARLLKQEPVAGASVLREIHPAFVMRLQAWVQSPDGPIITLDDFHAYMPAHTYIFLPSREFWPASSVDARIRPVGGGEGKPVRASLWLDRHRSVEQMTWAPGRPTIVADQLVSDGGWIDHAGCSTINLYRPPTITAGDAAGAGPWLTLVRTIYPDYADHIIAWLAHRVQEPHEKINHALVLGGAPGIGKDTLLEPVKYAVGPWNFSEISPSHLLGRFNGFAKAVILRISEARDLGEMNRFDFYERLKIYAAAPPDVIRVDEKNIREHAIFNVCGVIITTNHETDGIYLPADDRRHFVAWSPVTPTDFHAEFWAGIYDWYRRAAISTSPPISPASTCLLSIRKRRRQRRPLSGTSWMRTGPRKMPSWPTCSTCSSSRRPSRSPKSSTCARLAQAA